jgi:hypothetical protein
MRVNRAWHCQRTVTLTNVRQETRHPRYLRRRHRADEYQRLLVRCNGIQDAEHRSHRQGGYDVHRLLRRAKLHCRKVDFYHWAMHIAYWPFQSRATCRHRWTSSRRIPTDRRTSTSAQSHRRAKNPTGCRPTRSGSSNCYSVCTVRRRSCSRRRGSCRMSRK